MSDTIEVSTYAHIGKFYVLRDALPSNHPESTYQQIVKQGEIPEDFGYSKTEAHIREESRLNKSCPMCGW